MPSPAARLALAAALLLAVPAAQAATDNDPGLVIRKDPALAQAGRYTLDPGHTSVVARVPHMTGMSYSVFRFGAVAGSLAWDPERPEASRLDVTVQTRSIDTPVAGFAEQLRGADYLDVAKFPEARFVSTRIERTGPTTGRITGDLTLMGRTAPMTIEAELVGAGKSLRGFPTAGFTGKARIRRSDFGFSAFRFYFGDEIELVLDAEFNLRPPA